MRWWQDMVERSNRPWSSNMQSAMTLRTWQLLVLFLATLTSVSGAQTVGGQIGGAPSRQPLAAVRALLIDSVSGKEVDSGVTDTSGVFYLNAPKAGVYFLRFGRIGALP